MSGRARRAWVSTTPWSSAKAPWRWVAVDAAALLALAALIALVLYPVYGTPLLFVSVMGFAAVGAGIVVLGTLRRLRTGGTVLAAIGAWFLLGAPLTMPSSTIAGIIPTPRTLYGLLVGPVTAWRDMLTLDPPIGETFNLLVVPGLIGFLVGLIGFSFSLRSDHPVAAWVPAGVGYVVAAAFGSTVSLWPLWSGIAFFVIVVVWTTVRRGTMRDQLSSTPATLRPVRFVFGAAMLVVAALVGLVVAPAVAKTPERDTLRALVDIPINLREHRSPLQAFRANISKFRDETLLIVRGGRPGDIVRVATLDVYDGLSYRVSTLDDEAMDETTFRRVGQWIADDSEGDRITLDVEVHGYESVWVPTVGRTTSVRFDGDRSIELGENFFYNHATGTGVDASGLQRGDHYELQAIVTPRPPDEDIAAAAAGKLQQPRVAGVPEQVRSLAVQWTEGIAGAGEQALQLEQQLQKGYFSHGQPDEVTSVPGHSQHRLAKLLADPNLMIGDHEQYAVAMALMARELGIPARVIYGYEVRSSAQITGENVGAWPELYFEELGWVRFNPTPPETQKADELEPPDPPLPQPYIENPPPPPAKPEVPLPEEQLPIETGEPPADQITIDWGEVGRIALITGIPLLTIVVPIALIVGLKWRRKVRRRNDPQVANRVAGAWLELVDKARDLGRSPSVSATRSEQAAQIAENFKRIGDKSDPVALAKEADWLVFAPGDPAEHVARDYWRESKAVRTDMRKSVGLPKWVASGLSTKSFRKVK